METFLLDLSKKEFYWNYIKRAAHALKTGELVAFPTETVYGLGAHLNDAKAIERIYEVKGRPEDKKLTLMVADREDVKKYVKCISRTATKLMDFFWPGPLAIIFPTNDDTDISIRLPDNEIARNLIRTAEIPVATTSANVSGHPASVNAQQVLKELGGKINIILDGGSTRFQSPSTMVKPDDGIVKIIRQGIISETAIWSCLNTK